MQYVPLRLLEDEGSDVLFSFASYWSETDEVLPVLCRNRRRQRKTARIEANADVRKKEDREPNDNMLDYSANQGVMTKRI